MKQHIPSFPKSASPPPKLSFMREKELCPVPILLCPQVVSVCLLIDTEVKNHFNGARRKAIISEGGRWTGRKNNNNDAENGYEWRKGGHPALRHDKGRLKSAQGGWEASWLKLQEYLVKWVWYWIFVFLEREGVFAGEEVAWRVG